MQSCFLGYSLDEDHQSQGLMTEALKSLIDHIFNDWGLHRIQANYLPTNGPSARVLEKLGFEKEGVAKNYLRIDGQWQDHVLTARINPNEELK
jgi:ribosomal-protein-alanine N-acetyltransferase